MAQPIVFSTLSKIAYPLFEAKLADVRGSENLPRSGGYVLASNHVDWLDGFFVATAVYGARHVPVYFVTKSNYYWWTTITIQIPKKKDAIVDETVRHLRAGRTICIFPEGERNSTKRLWPGKTGAVRMALEAGVPIVPLGITCSYGRNMGQSVLNLLSRGHEVTIKIGKPLTIKAPTGAVTNDWLHQETQRVMKAISPLCGKSV